MSTEHFRHQNMIPSPAASAAVVTMWATEDGYAIGCLFHHTDGGDGTALYVNEGTATSCNFNAITVGS
jgi:hypothetical protein